jgi:hypothetical protein
LNRERERAQERERELKRERAQERERELKRERERSPTLKKMRCSHLVYLLLHPNDRFGTHRQGLPEAVSPPLEQWVCAGRSLLTLNLTPVIE